MIENLNGFFEIINFQKLPSMKLYLNNTPDNYPPHWHNAIEIIMPLENEYTVICNNTTFQLEEYDIAIIPPRSIHTLLSPLNGKRLIFQISSSVFDNIKELSTVLFTIAPLLIITPEHYPHIHSHLVSLFLEIQEEYFHADSFSECIIYSKLFQIFALWGREHAKLSLPDKNLSIKNKDHTEKILVICDYIAEHCTEDLTLDSIAQLAGFSKYHFSRLFKQVTHISFYRFLSQKRIMHSEKLLNNPNFTITEVAIQSGFSNLPSFIRMFKQLKGCTPSQFRKIYCPDIIYDENIFHRL